MTSVRLDKFLANGGYVSRRGVKQFLKNNNVTVNGKRVRESGERIEPQKDNIQINDEKVKQVDYVYFLLNKPKGIVSTSSDEFDRKNVTDLIDTDKRVYPVGRLDKETHGLILLTNDGELTQKLTHPSFHVSKKYILEIRGKVSKEKIKKLENGVMISDGITSAAKVKKVKEKDKSTILEMEIFEGRYRQIRRMCEAIYLDLIDLKRIQFGPIRDSRIKEGSYRELTENEIKTLKMSSSQTSQHKKA